MIGRKLLARDRCQLPNDEANETGTPYCLSLTTIRKCTLSARRRDATRRRLKRNRSEKNPRTEGFGETPRFWRTPKYHSLDGGLRRADVRDNLIRYRIHQKVFGILREIGEKRGFH